MSRIINREKGPGVAPEVARKELAAGKSGRPRSKEEKEVAWGDTYDSRRSKISE